MRDKKNPGDEDDLETRKRQYTERGRERARERFTGRDRSDDRRSERQSDYAGLGTAPSSNSMNTGMQFVSLWGQFEREKYLCQCLTGLRFSMFSF